MDVLYILNYNSIEKHEMSIAQRGYMPGACFCYARFCSKAYQGMKGGRRKPMEQLRNMNYEHVSLCAGRCQEQLNDITRYLLNLDEDRLLHLFRKGAGLPAPGTTYFGWYGQGATTFGQWIAAMAKLYHVTGDQRMKAKLTRCLDGWAACIMPEGYPRFSTENASTYGFEKIVGGLVDAYAYAEYAPAMDLLERIMYWADTSFDAHMPQEYQTYAFLAARGMHEWYTLSENFYRAYRLSGREVFHSFAKKWDYTLFWQDMRAGNDALPPLHAYSHVNSLCGAAQKYLITKDPQYLDVITHAYDLLTAGHLYATGGYGPAEALFGQAGYLGDALFSSRDRAEQGMHRFSDLEGTDTSDDVWGNCEVSCCAWAVFKLCNYLMTITGEARYGEWVERLLINGTLAQLPLADNGKVEYYANYFRFGGRKDVEDRRIGPIGNANVWQCCTGTFPQDVIAYHELIYYQTEDAVCISQYIPSRGAFTLSQGKLMLEILGDYPQAQQMVIRVNPGEEDMLCTLRFRIPGWAENARVLVNDQPTQDIPLPHTWYQVSRRWRRGDTVTLEFPFQLRFEVVDPQHPTVAALVWGPLVLASDELMTLRGDMHQPQDWILPVPGEAGVFCTLAGHDQAFPDRRHTFRPFYSIPGGQWYYMYTVVAP